MDKPCILVISGSDSCGGAGLQADVKTAAALGVHAACAVTCITAQNTTSFQGVQMVDEKMLKAQVDAVASDFDIAAVKVGMLGSVRMVDAVVGALTTLREENPRLPIVVDPVLKATTGGPMDAERIGRALARDLLPLATMVTPNLPEARDLAELCRLVLARKSPSGDMPPEAPLLGSDKALSSWSARILLAAGARSVVVKGGHGAAPDDCTDLLFLRQGDPLAVIAQFAEAQEEPACPRMSMGFMIPAQDENYCVPLSFSAPRRSGEHHGTGCVLSTALACNLALGHSLPDAMAHSHGFLKERLCSSRQLGQGSLLIDL